MIDLYCKLKILDWVLYAGFVILLFLICVIVSLVEIYKSKRTDKLFIRNGYHRELIGVPSFGNGAFYGWVKKDSENRHVVDDRDIKNMKYKCIKEKYNLK